MPEGTTDMLRKVYLLFATLLIAGYALAEVRGWELTSAHRDQIPMSVRNSPGGYRSYHFWHSGYHGGK